MIRIVCMQDGRNSHLPGLLVELLRGLSESVCLGILTDLEQLRAVHVLQRRLVVVADGQLMSRLDEEGVRLAKVPHVVAQRRHQQRILLGWTQPQPPGSEAHESEDRVQHVTGVGEAVVGNIQVLRFHRLDEGREDTVLAKGRCQPKFRVEEDVHDGLVSLDSRQFEYIEVPGLHANLHLSLRTSQRQGPCPEVGWCRLHVLVAGNLDPHHLDQDSLLVLTLLGHFLLADLILVQRLPCNPRELLQGTLNELELRCPGRVVFVLVLLIRGRSTEVKKGLGGALETAEHLLQRSYKHLIQDAPEVEGHEHHHQHDDKDQDDLHER
mmetsp:Transcript_69591/g.163442  ORF Transcript_69591/g.163442 Transcript_69591/m.163442 type:complete len:324 (-) Transcript_69591:34-1005(-)